MPTFNNLTDLQKHIQSAIDGVLKQEVATEVKHVMAKNIYQTVYTYNAKNPQRRRSGSGGLMDESLMLGTIPETGTLIVSSIATPNPLRHNEVRGYPDDDNSYFNNAFDQRYRLVDIVAEQHTGGLFSSSNPARNFIKTTREDLSAHGQHTQALKDGLTKRYGMDVR